jgi:CRISPR-associated protein (TIGR03986 family)
MNPKHIKEIRQTDRIAKAPYNFVELPEKVVEAQELPSGDRYHPNKDVEIPRHTGRIECTLTTKSPLYIRCGLTTEEFKAGKEAKDLPDFFYTDTDPTSKSNKAVLPGSSLRGMLRTLVEIVSFGKIDRVSEQQHFFFRAVAADKNDPLKDEYQKYVKPKNIKAGYLVQRPNGWFIRPAMPVDEAPFVWVKEDKLRSISGFIPMNNLSEYRPQYLINISFQDPYLKNTRRFAGKVSSNCTTYKYQGVVVTSGNMLEGGNNPGDLKRQNHCIIREPNPKAEPIQICEDAIQDYYSALTPFQKQEPPFDENRGVLKNGRCIFYCQPQAGEPVTLFGQSPNFRIPYSHQGNGKAATARDFIPDFLKDSKDKPAITDIAEAIFGFVRRDKQPEGREQSRAGRVFISDGILKPHQEEKVQQSLNQEPKTILLSSPKPTTFQHYLVQSQETGANKSQLKHYASPPPNDTAPGKTVIRGHKLYWHKPAHIEVPSDASDTQMSLIKPIDEDINFSFTIYLENLSKVELGALLWVLDRADLPEYCLSVGMGKPLGMGAVNVKIDELWLGDRTQRYHTLFTDNNHWTYGEKANTDSAREECIKAFENYVLDNIHENDHPEGRKATSLDELPRIEMLLAMLQCEGLQNSLDVEYMTIEPNEYKERRVLPTPLQIARIDDNRRVDQTSSPSTLPRVVVKSERQVEIAKAVKSKKFEIGQILEATIASINGNKVTYHMLEVLKLTEKEPKKAGLLTEGQAVYVKITALKEDGSIKSVKCVD